MARDKLYIKKRKKCKLLSAIQFNIQVRDHLKSTGSFAESVYYVPRVYKLM